MSKLSELGLRPKEIRLMRKKDTGNELFCFAFRSTESRQLNLTDLVLKTLSSIFETSSNFINQTPPTKLHQISSINLPYS